MAVTVLGQQLVEARDPLHLTRWNSSLTGSGEVGARRLLTSMPCFTSSALSTWLMSGAAAAAGAGLAA